MKNIKTYEDFVNEEINLRKGLIGAALATSLMGGMTSCGDSIGNKEYTYKPSTEMTDYEIKKKINNENKSKSQFFKIPFTIKNLPEEINVKFYDSKNNEVDYFTVYYMLDDDYFKDTKNLTKEMRDSITIDKFEKIKKLIFKGEPKCVIDFKSEITSSIMKKIQIHEKIESNIYLKGDKRSLNLSDDFSSLKLSMSDYGFTLLNSEGDMVERIVPSVYESELKVIYTKK